MSNTTMTSTNLLAVGWFLWCLSVVAVCAQIMEKNSSLTTLTSSALRFLEEKDAADEDDLYVEDGITVVDDDLEWFQLERWLDPSSLAYDIIEGFLYVADAFFIAWVLWGCLVHCGVLPDERLNRKQRHRRLKDGRGVFSPIQNFDAVESSDDDDASRDSMEYGYSHENEILDDDVDIQQEEKNLVKAAEKYFSKAEKHKKEMENAPGPAEEGVLLLDLEMADQPVEKYPKPDVMFL
jgi:hypothetical protein